MNHPTHRLRTLLLVAAAAAVAMFAPGLVLLTLSVGIGLLLGIVLLGALAFWAVRRQVRGVLREQSWPVVDGVVDGAVDGVPKNVIDGVIVEAR